MLANTANNHFGVKGEFNGNYIRANDDKPNEKFKKYDNVGQSYEDHSKVLMADRYQKYVRGLAADDYKGWIAGIQKGGYASSKAYCNTIISVIESCGLQKYDSIVMKEGGQSLAKAKTQTDTQSHTASVTTPSPAVTTNAGYSMPVERSEFMLVTSPYGMREHPIDHIQKMHSGIDIKTNHDNLLATEDGGKVVEAGFDKNGGSGNYVKLEYTRDDGSKTQISYSHLSEMKVKAGDTVNAGQILGVSGSTGKSTGDHLHLAVKQISADGNTRQLDPAAYLAEVAEKGNLQQQALSNGKDLLAKYKSQDNTNGNSLAQVNTNMSADDWMKKLLSSEDSGLDLKNSSDPIIEMVTGAFTGLMAIAVQIDNKTEEEKKQMVVDAATSKSINLTPYMAYHQNCSISVQDNGNAVLKVDDTTKTLSQEEMKNLSAILHSSQSDEAKMKNIAMFVDGIQLSTTASQKYEMAANLSQEQSNVIQR